MNRFRNGDSSLALPQQLSQAQQRPLRVIATGTLFVTHTLCLQSHPAPSSITRAHAVSRSRGGSAPIVLAALAQLGSMGPHVFDAQLVAPLAANDEGRTIMRELENEGIGLRYCKIWEGANVPSAWVLQSADTSTSSVINHNPLPDITHEEFVSLLGPLLAPENYNIDYLTAYPSPAISPVAPNASSSPNPRSPPSPRTTGSRPNTATRLPNPFQPQQGSSPGGSQNSATNPNAGLQNIVNSPAPFEWLHFEGRSVKTTMNNMIGIHGLARERKWRAHCVFSLDLGRKPRAGLEALIAHADVIFTTYQYAQAMSNLAQPPASPRAFLLSMLAHAPKHALLVAYWGQNGGAVLSVPTKEYFQSSGWVGATRSATGQKRGDGDAGGTSPDDGRNGRRRLRGQASVRSGSEFYAGVTRKRAPSNSTYTAGDSISIPTSTSHGECDSDNDTETGADEDEENGVIDEVGAQNAFVAGMMYALSRKLLPGAPWTPGGQDVKLEFRPEDGFDKWRLDECLRFATEFAGRKARRRNWDGLVTEMAGSGWFD